VVCDKAGVGPTTLAHPLDKLLFAGEATDKGHYGTVTGAMLAGIREGGRAREILREMRPES